MAKIPLRTYTREIERHIDQGQIDEAIAHCRHILKAFPKNLAAYRLLGKAYLESQRYGDAADIFMRVLSATPDDFVSHVGMGIIREDEGNQDAAIWHMERAFEVQPYNSAIQGELRRLYGKRDGLEPPRVRLTRGALARMYAKGDLYQQAIGELRSALASDPQRPDLQVVLAGVYFMMGNKVEAIEISTSLIKKLPYCLEANRIIAAILPETDRKEETQAYLQRVIDLDPYLGLVKFQLGSAEDVPDNAVVIEKLDWQPGSEDFGSPSQPAWAASLGVSIEPFGTKKEGLPDWLSTTGADPSDLESSNLAASTGAAGATPAFDNLDWEDLEEGEGDVPELTGPSDENLDWLSSTDQVAEDATLPDWMQAAGWQQSEASSETASTSMENYVPDFSDDEEEQDSDLKPGEIPDWLRAMAPPGAIEEPESLEDLEVDDALPWLQELDRKAATQADLPEEEAHSIDAEIPTWLDEENLETPAEIEAEAVAEADIPDWLAGLGEDEALETPAEIETEALTEADIPDWLAGLGEDETLETPTEIEAEAVAEADIPDWLAGLSEDEALETPADIEAEAVAETDIPDWLTGLEEDETLETPAEIEAEAVAEADIPDWLAGLSEDEALETPADIEAEAVAETDIPDWLTGLEEDETLETPTEIEAEAVAEADIPDWLAGLGEDEELETPAEIEAEAVAEADIPDWLTGLEEDETLETPAEIEAEAVAEADIPDWLAELELEAADDEPDVVEDLEAQTSEAAIEWRSESDLSITEPEDLDTAPTELAAPAEGVFSGMDLDDENATMAWLESLAAKHGVSEDEFISQPEARSEDIPDWVQDEIDAAPQEDIEPASLDEEPVAYAQPGSDPSEELSEIVDLTPAELDESPAIEIESSTPSDGLPGWLLEIDTETSEIPEFEETPSEPLSSESIPDWLENLELNDISEESEPEIELSSEEELVSTPVGEPITDWRGDQDYITIEEPEQGSEPEPVSAEQPPSEAEEPLPDWLSELEETLQAGPEEEIIEETSTIEDIPTWLEELEREEAQTEAQEEFGLPVFEDTQSEAVSAELAPVDTHTQPSDVPQSVDMEDEEAVMAWLEGLAAMHGVDEEELVTRPEDRPAVAYTPAEPEPPEDVEVEDTQPVILAPIEEPDQEMVTTEQLAEPEPVGGVPTLQEEMDQISQAEVEESEPELPDWLKDATSEEPEDDYAWMPPSLVEELAAAQTDSSEPASEPEPIHLVDANTASLVELENIPGVGFRLAQAIMEYRRLHGFFQTVEDLAKVPGIDAERLPELSRQLQVTPQAPLHTKVTPSSKPSQATEAEQAILATAQAELVRGNLAASMEQYVTLIKKESLLDEIIGDLQDSLYTHPMEIHIWQTLGDAYFRKDQLQDALEAYIRAEELLR